MLQIADSHCYAKQLKNASIEGNAAAAVPTLKWLVSPKKSQHSNIPYPKDLKLEIPVNLKGRIGCVIPKENTPLS